MACGKDNNPGRNEILPVSDDTVDPKLLRRLVV